MKFSVMFHNRLRCIFIPNHLYVICDILKDDRRWDLAKQRPEWPSFITHRTLFLASLFLFPKQKLQRNSQVWGSEIRVLSASPVILNKANSKLMSFKTTQRHALQAQQPAEFHHFQIYKVVCNHRVCPCKFPFDAQIEVEINLWLYLNHKKSHDSIYLPLRDALLVLTPKNTLFAQSKVYSVSEMKHFERSYALQKMQLMILICSCPLPLVYVPIDEKYERTKIVYLKQIFIVSVTKVK